MLDVRAGGFRCAATDTTKEHSPHPVSTLFTQSEGNACAQLDRGTKQQGLLTGRMEARNATLSSATV